MIRTKRVYEPKATEDGTRVLVMRLWPRGIRKETVDLWLKELGAELANLKAYKAGTIDWPEMRRRYLAGLARPDCQAALGELRRLAAPGTVTLLCSCEDETRCHRTLLAAALATKRPARKARRVPGPGAGGPPRGTR